MPLAPKISVVLPFYNAENTLARAVESILVQKFQGFELILVDNNSTDNSRRIAENFIKEDERAVLLTEATQGVSHACNTGLKYAQGEYIARMDADDVSLPDRLLKQAGFLDQNPQVMAVASRVKHCSVLPSDGMLRFVEWSNRQLTHEQIFLKRFVEQPVVTPSLMWRKKLSGSGDLFSHEADVPEDYEAILQWLSCKHRIEKIDAVLHHWHDSQNRLTRTDARYTVDAFNTVKCRYLMKWLQEEGVPNSRGISVWGAGKSSRKKSDLLVEMGLKIDSFIDVRENTQKVPPVVFYENVDKYVDNFILSNVTSWGAREKIQQFLESRGLVEGGDFIHIA